MDASRATGNLHTRGSFLPDADPVRRRTSTTATTRAVPRSATPGPVRACPASFHQPARPSPAKLTYRPPFDQHPFDQPVTVDATGRMTLPASARVAVDVRAGALAQMTECREPLDARQAQVSSGRLRGIRAVGVDRLARDCQKLGVSGVV